MLGEVTFRVTSAPNLVIGTEQNTSTMADMVNIVETLFPLCEVNACHYNDDGDHYYYYYFHYSHLHEC